MEKYGITMHVSFISFPKFHGKVPEYDHNVSVVSLDWLQVFKCQIWI